MTDRELMQQALDALDEGLTMKEWRELVAALRDRLAQPEQSEVTVLPDGSAFGVMSYPLPKTHWLFAEREYEDGQHEPIELGNPILTHELRDAVVSAVRYAIRGATNCGKEMDFDPDALVQNAVYALCGPYRKSPSQPDYAAWARHLKEPMPQKRVHESDTMERECNPHPDAPHGFNRESSHSLGRYVCDCEGWEPEPWDTTDMAHRPNGLSMEQSTECVEPVAWLSRDDARLALWDAINKREFGNPTDDKLILDHLRKNGLWIGKYTSPPASKPWVGLTDVEWMNIVNKDHAWFGQRPEDVAHEVAKLVEAKLKEKNT